MTTTLSCMMNKYVFWINLIFFLIFMIIFLCILNCLRDRHYAWFIQRDEFGKHKLPKGIKWRDFNHGKLILISSLLWPQIICLCFCIWSSVWFLCKVLTWFGQFKSALWEGSCMYLHVLPNAFASGSKLHILQALIRECLLQQHVKHGLMDLANHMPCQL